MRTGRRIAAGSFRPQGTIVVVKEWNIDGSPLEAGTDAAPAATLDNLRMDPTDGSVRIGTQDLPVTASEFRILHALVTTPAIVVRRTALLGVLSKGETFAASRCLDVHISRLRTKLRSHGYAIRTVKGIGYRFMAAMVPPAHRDPAPSRRRRIILSVG